MTHHTKRRTYAVLARRRDLGPSPRRRSGAGAPRRAHQPQMVDMLKKVDERQHNNGDWRAKAYIEQKEKDKVDVVYETVYFRRARIRSS